MSGPKDYTVVYSAARAAQLLAEVAAIRKARAARKAKQLKALSEQAKVRAEKILAQKVEANRLANQHRLRDANPAASSHASNTETFQSESTSASQTLIAAQLAETRTALQDYAALVGNSNNSQLESFERQFKRVETSEHTADAQTAIIALASEIRAADQEAKSDASDLRSRLQQVAEWADFLSQDSEVQTFQQQEYVAWKQEADNLLNSIDPTQPVKELILAAQKSLADAEVIDSATTELKGKFAARSELLKSIMDSLNEAGFYVSNPSYSDETNPESAVVVKASKGGEEMTTWVDLSEHVRSDWRQTEQGGCKESYFDFVDAMKQNGVEILPDRKDLQDRPLLKQKGAKDLPTTNYGERGAQ